MPTKGERIIAIMQEERGRTMAALDALDWPETSVQDVVALWGEVQQAINAYVGREDRAIDARVVPTLLRLAADETERITARLLGEGLAPRVG